VKSTNALAILFNFFHEVQVLLAAFVEHNYDMLCVHAVCENMELGGRFLLSQSVNTAVQCVVLCQFMMPTLPLALYL